MARFYTFLLGLICGAMALYAVMNFHVIRARDGFHFVNKQPPRIAETYVDIRRFGMGDWAGRPQLVSALGSSNQHGLLGEAATGAIGEGMEKMLPTWPATSSTP